jgi:voltage-gated potassium channel
MIDKVVEHLEQMASNQFYLVAGDATFDEVMRQAKIETAHGIVVATPDDADNLLIVLSARTLNPDIFIVVRVTTPENESKMIRAGANRVVSPYRMGGKHMANVMLRPHIADFIDNVTLDSGEELWMEEVKIAGNSTLVGKTVVESNIRQKTGVNLITIRLSATGKLHIPDQTVILTAGDDLIVLGTRSQLNALTELSHPT